MTLSYLGAQPADTDSARGFRLRIRNKSLKIHEVRSATSDPQDLTKVVDEDVWSSPQTSVALTVTRDGLTIHPVPAFKPAWMKRLAHVRRWLEKGRLPSGMGYDEVVRAVVRCFYFETEQTEKLVRDLRRVLCRIIVDGDRPTALERAYTLLGDVFQQHHGVIANSPAMNHLFDLWMTARYLTFQEAHPRQAIRRGATAGILRNISTESEEFTAAIAELESTCRTFLPLGAAHLHLGHLASLRGNRRAAVAAYAEARRTFPGVGDPGTEAHPVSTYRIPPDSEERLVTVPRLRWLQTSVTQPGSKEFPVVLFSVSSSFLKQCFLRLAPHLLLFPEFTYHIHVVAERVEAEETMDLCTDLLTLALRLRDQPADAVTIDWSWSRVPEWAGLPATYISGARYLIAAQIMEAYRSDVWIQDVDLLPPGDLRAVAGRAREADVMLHMDQRMNGIIPWRRYLAGNVLVRRTDNGRAFLAATAWYLRSFLHQENSWCLDQHALAYAVETVPDDTLFLNTAAVRAPLTQGRLPALIEA